MPDGSKSPANAVRRPKISPADAVEASELAAIAAAPPDAALQLLEAAVIEFRTRAAERDNQAASPDAGAIAYGLLELALAVRFHAQLTARALYGIEHVLCGLQTSLEMLA